MNQASYEWLTVSHNDLFLPVLKADGSKMLSPWAMLGDEARPVL
jgi:hypothetical protein